MSTVWWILSGFFWQMASFSPPQWLPPLFGVTANLRKQIGCLLWKRKKNVSEGGGRNGSISKVFISQTAAVWPSWVISRPWSLNNRTPKIAGWLTVNFHQFYIFLRQISRPTAKKLITKLSLCRGDVHRCSLSSRFRVKCPFSSWVRLRVAFADTRYRTTLIVYF